MVYITVHHDVPRMRPWFWWYFDSSSGCNINTLVICIVITLVVIIH